MPEGYPFQPLQMRFISKVRQGDMLMQVYHPNVSSQSGAICLDILKGACGRTDRQTSGRPSIRSNRC